MKQNSSSKTFSVSVQSKTKSLMFVTGMNVKALLAFADSHMMAVHRGYIYWRLLSSDPEKTKKIVLSDRPVLAEDIVSFEPTLLENLVDNMSNVSSVFYKPPETIIPKIVVDYNKYPLIFGKKIQLMLL